MMTVRSPLFRMICAVFMVFVSGAAACRGSSGAAQVFPSSDVAAPSEVSGAFEFTANLPGGMLTGFIAILPDTIILEPSTGQCKARSGTMNPPRGALYECTFGATIWIDRYSTQGWRWTATESVMRTRRVCVDYVTRSGRRVCVREVNERYWVPVQRRGNLNVRPREG